MRANPKSGNDVSRVPRTGSTRSKPQSERRKNIALPDKSPEASLPKDPTADDIARLAYAIWEERGRPSGSGEEDWLLAEQKILQGS